MSGNTYKIIFYKAWNGTIIDKAISLWTFGRYSHVEVVEFGPGSHHTSYSASSRDGGVRSKIGIDYNNGNWDVYDIDIKDYKLKELFDYTNGKKYDWIGIFFYHFLPFKLQANDKWYCSEWIAKLLVDSGYNEFYNDINLTPSGLHKKLIEYNIISKSGE